MITEHHRFESKLNNQWFELLIKDDKQIYRDNIYLQDLDITNSKHYFYIEMLNHYKERIHDWTYIPIILSNNNITENKSEPINSNKKKCICEWSGPNGVYAIGCRCGGI